MKIPQIKMNKEIAMTKPSSKCFYLITLDIFNNNSKTRSNFIRQRTVRIYQLSNKLLPKAIRLYTVIILLQQRLMGKISKLTFLVPLENKT